MKTFIQLPISKSWIWRYSLEIIISVFVGLLSLGISLWRAGAQDINLNQPLSYIGDPIHVANMISAAQAGNPFSFDNLGAPSGQSWAYTAFGAEWMQATFASMFDAGKTGPWLASNLYLLFSVFLVAACAYIASRWIGLTHLPSILTGITFGMIRGPFAWSGWPFLQNLGGSLLFIAIAVKFAMGDDLEKLLPNLPKAMSVSVKRGLGASAIAATCLISLSSGNYFMWFTAITLFLFSLPFLVSKNYRQRGKRLFFLGTSQIAIIFIALAPILFSRLFEYQSINEQSTVDRRAFAALANGGEFPGLFMSESGAISSNLFKNIPAFRAFLSEYETSPLVTASYYRGGIAVLFAFAIIAFLLTRRISRSQNNFSADLNISKATVITLALLGITVLLYLRGGLGLFISFVFPFLRAFDRIIALVIFLALVVVGLFFTGKHQSKIKKFTGNFLLVICLIDYSSGIHPYIPQDLTNNGLNSKGFAIGSTGKSFIPATYETIKSLGTVAEKELQNDCSVLVLPMNTFPVDFESGITSFFSYDTLKPGLETKKIKWTSGYIPDTKGTQISKQYRDLYLEKKYVELMSAAENYGTCAVAIFGNLQDAMHAAVPEKFDAAQTVVKTVKSKFNRVCFSSTQAEITLLCPSN